MNRIISTTALTLITICLINVGLALGQEESHSLPTGLTFHTESAFDETLFYVDPVTLEMNPLIEFSQGGRPKTLSWSPDGEYFALVNDLMGLLEDPDKLCIYTAEGEEVLCHDLMLWYPSAYRFPISWDSDGESISVLLRGGNNHNRPQLGQIDLATNSLRPGHILDLDRAELMMIYWSPTGEFVAYQTNSGSESNALHLYLLDIATGSRLLVTERSLENYIAWSNDGTNLGVIHNIWRQEEFPFLRQSDGLTIYDTNGRIVDHVYAIHEGQSVPMCPFAWSNDDTKIAFYAGFLTNDDEINGGIFVTEIDNGETMLVAIDNQANGVVSISWSPDDTHLILETIHHAFRDVRVYSLDGWAQVFTSEGLPSFDPAWRPNP